MAKEKKPEFKLPKLPYDTDGLEPSIDQETMELHHGTHHQAYVDGLNDTVKKLPDDYQNMHLVNLVSNVNTAPEEHQEALRFHAGGHLNHSLLWQTMTPGGSEEPEGKLGSAIKKGFGGLDKLKEQFEEAALNIKGSGWVWLVCDHDGNLKIVSTANQDSPYMSGLIPILGLDMWEHSFYKQYGPDKQKYIEAWWNVINWDKVSEILEAVKL